MTKEESLLSEVARKLRKLDCICEGVNSTGNIVIKNYQPLDCVGAPVGAPISVMPTISVAKQDVAICNYQQVADAINGAAVVAYNIPKIENASSNWALLTNNNIFKVHFISISIVGTAGGTVNFSINNGTAVSLPVGFTYTDTATTTFGVNFTLTTFAGGATAIISTRQSA